MSDWKQIDNLPYSVNKNGDVRNDRTGKILKPVIVSGGYLQVPESVPGIGESHYHP